VGYVSFRLWDAVLAIVIFAVHCLISRSIDAVRAPIPLESSQNILADDRRRVCFLPTNNEQRPKTKLRIGVLALQGDFDAHRKRLEQLGADVVLVKKPEQLDSIDGLVIPGGESSTFLKLLGETGFQKLKEFVRLKPTFGTCAGAILLARDIENPKQVGLGAIDIAIRRNAYGRQVDSSIREGIFREAPIEMVFIRAPKIEHLGPDVEVLATESRDPVVVRQGKTMAATFHPELSEDTSIHQAFLDLVRNGRQR
jgi:5'-phosphate synthase pdxT subunit